ncbi:MAG: DUF3788 family protein [Planctomycetes bacterium]|nr:DUF3788 family protein [Planctomycetota bacterium]
MALSAFDDKACPPVERTLEEALGRASGLWCRLKDDLQAAYGPLLEEWSFSGKAYGWSFRLKQKKRVLVYMTPCRAHFLASFALGEKACLAAHAMELPASLLAIIDAAPQYAEGRGVRIPVRSKRDLENVEKVAALKVAH